MKKRVFGERCENLSYQLRKGAYAVIFDETREHFAAVRLDNGRYFLPGGGIENDETEKECLKRELIEETGYAIEIGSFIGNAGCYFVSKRKKPMYSDGYFYLAKLKEKIQEPIEVNQELVWLKTTSAQESLLHAHQAWAVLKGKECLEEIPL